MERSIVLLTFCAWFASLVPGIMLQVQAQSGFISIDCGAPNAYTHDTFNISFETDKGYIDSGENRQISAKLIDEQNYYNLYKNLRSFPNGMRNCYTLRPDKDKSNTYLIRASFWYGNYDEKNQIPIFDLYIDVNYWATIKTSKNVFQEIVYVPQRDYIQVCLINIGKGVPFISALELRTLDSSLYQIKSGFLGLVRRYDITRNSNFDIRYPDDVYDRIWQRWTINSFMLNPGTGTSASELSKNNDAYKVPGEVLLTAETANNGPLFFPSNNSMNRWIGYFHFAETRSLPSGQQREFTISTSDGQFKETVRLEYLKPVTIISTPVTGSMINFSFQAQSGHPSPIINALEIFLIQELPNVPTALDDVKALTDTKVEYTMNKDSWQGDPCVPSKFVWYGVNCSYRDTPRVISLNLSSSNLRGNIFSSLSNLSELESLDLSNNELNGVIPETLANLSKLRILNLSGNKLNGSVPEALKRKVKDNGLDLRFNNNPDLCWASSCPKEEAKTKNSILVPVVASVSVIVVVICLTICLIRRKQIRESKIRRSISFKHGDISRITNKFETAIGEGASGRVYLGELENTKVAVKVLSKSSEAESSGQPDKLFLAEAQLLTKVHHGNLVSLKGYCDDSKNKALIYEFMANGNLKQHLSGEVVGVTGAKPDVLTWDRRLRIAVDVAQGLNYLHNDCNPSIIHRDIKTTNILLNENMQAKISDFGLSRALATPNSSYKSSNPWGTPAYCPPEYGPSTYDNKSDVYSFGIVLLELISGHPVINTSEPGKSVHIRDWAIPKFQSRYIRGLIDPKVEKKFDINSAEIVAEVAKSCTQTEPSARPDINLVLTELKGAIELASKHKYADGNQEEHIGATSLGVESDSVPLVRVVH